jgi:hypothetical protein
VCAGDGGDLGFIGRPRWLDRVPVAGGGEERRDDFAHGVVQDQAVRSELRERQRAQHVVGVVRAYIRQQGIEE